MKSIILWSVLGFGMIVALGESRAAEFIGLGEDTMAWGISADGRTVVGEIDTGGTREAFRWTATTGVVGLGFLPGHTISTAAGVSGDGSVVVGTCEGVIGHAFRWTEAEGMMDLGDIDVPGRGSEAVAVSDDGLTIVGSSSLGPASGAFRWTPAGGMVVYWSFPGGRFVPRGASPDAAVVVGVWDTPGDSQAGVWRDGNVTALPNPADPFTGAGDAVDASADGSVVVGHYEREDVDIACYWENGNVRDFDPGGIRAHAVSADGALIVGTKPQIAGEGGAFIWDDANGVRSLPTVLRDDYGIDLTGWQLAVATSISADGQVIAGWGRHLGQIEGWVAVIPEPATLVLLALGFLSAAGRRRRAGR